MVEESILITSIIPTIGRISLNQSVKSILCQSIFHEKCETIIINDTGKPLPEMDWQSSAKVKIIQTDRIERSAARNAGAVLAKGKYLHFLDDDDWLLPEGLTALGNLTNQSEADILVGGTIMVDREGNPLRLFFPDINSDSFIQTMAGEWVPLQAALIKSSAFNQIGGFDITLTGSEDLDLIRRMAFKGSFFGNPEPVACISMGQNGSTTHWELHANQRQYARENVLDSPGVLSRLLESAQKTGCHQSYWHGKIVRIYLTSVLWNFQHRRLTTALRRIFYFLTIFALAVRNAFVKEYWQAVLKPHVSFSYLEGK
jgi:glycosyltransferase involved in cell wall biosynthesis